LRGGAFADNTAEDKMMRHFTKRRFRGLALLLASACAFVARGSYAVELVFELQGSNSLLAAPYLEALGLPMEAQDEAGTSLTTTYSGTITVDVDDVMNPTTITFVSATAAAANSGDWLPQEGGGDLGGPNPGDSNPGTAMPANYGFVFDEPTLFTTFYGASRETVLSLNSPATAIASNQFDLTMIGIEVAHGFFDANISSLAFPEAEQAGRLDLADPEDPTTGTNCTDHFNPGANSCGTDMGSYSVSGDTATLTVPLNFHIGGGTPVVQFTGTFTATASLVEEPDDLIGDYNEDGTVNAADYAVWRDNVGSTDTLPNDDIGGMIGQDHYNQWRAAFGNTSGGGSAAVPEPAGMALGIIAMFGLWLGRRVAV
jgi:hypothetical protein